MPRLARCRTRLNRSLSSSMKKSSERRALEEQMAAMRMELNDLRQLLSGGAVREPCE